MASMEETPVQATAMSLLNSLKEYFTVREQPDVRQPLDIPRRIPWAEPVWQPEQDGTQRYRMTYEDASQEITGIRHQAIIARLGRAGVRAGKTLQCAEDTLAETEQWDVSTERWGIWCGAATIAKSEVIIDIRGCIETLKKI